MIKDDIQNTIFISLKEGKQTEVKVLRFILSQIKYEEIELKRDLTDEEIIALMQKELKKRKEAIELFKKGKRDDLVKDEEKQLVVIERYLPKQMSIQELEKYVDETMQEFPKEANPGKLIGLVMAKVKGKADGSSVARLVHEKMKKSE